jgi:hypothetical protein
MKVIFREKARKTLKSVKTEKVKIGIAIDVFCRAESENTTFYFL